jgi:hypothetical protein
MQINFDTKNPDEVRLMLALAEALGGTVTGNNAPPAPAPTKKAVAKTPDNEPVKSAEAPLPESSAPAPDEVAPEPTQADAVKLATDLVAAGHATVVKFALRQLGVERVSKLADDDVPKFVAALTTDFDETKDASEQEG